MTNDALDNFIEAWGSLGVLWGINRSMARVHALLLVSENPVDLDGISERLGISRGNASMCLKELRNWGVIHRVHTSGDRRDFYVAEPDPWRMFFRIASERKKREFDPAFNALRHLLAEADIKDSSPVSERLMQMESLLSTVNELLSGFLSDEEKSRSVLGFLEGFVGNPAKN